MHVQGFHHLAVQAKDLERCCRFYRDLLGLTEQARHLRPDGSVRSIWLSLPENGFLALEHVPDLPERTDFSSPKPGLHLLALRIRREERPAWLEKLQAAGVEVVKESRWTVYVRDPEGNRVGLSHHPFDPLS